MQRGILQIGSDLVNVEINTRPLSSAMIEALRGFWRCMDANARAVINASVERHIRAVKAPEDLRANICLGYLFAAMDRLGLTAAWDAYAREVRWASL